MLLAAATQVACGDEGGECQVVDAAAFEQALGRCAVVVIEGGRLEGNFVVPSGVTVNGNGAEVLGAGGAAAIRLEGSGTLRGLTITNDGVGILAAGGGLVVIEDIEIVATKGIGIVAEGLDGLTLRRVAIAGPVNDALLPDLGERLDANEVAIAGLLVASSAVEMEEVEIGGFAGFGAVFFDSQGRWAQGRVHDFVGSGVLVERSVIELEGVQIEQGKRGQRIGFAIQTQGITVSAGSELRTVGVEINDIDGVGLLQDDATSAHLDLVVRDNRDAGLWIQRSPGGAQTPALSILGQQSVIQRNRGAGAVLREVGGVTLEGVLIADTTLAPHDVGADRLDIGDGFQLTGASRDVLLVDTTLRNNDRVGLLLDGTDNASVAPVSLEVRGLRIEDDREGSSGFGLIAQSGAEALLGEGAGIDVDPALAARDAAQIDLVPVVDTLDVILGAGGALDGGAVGDGGLINDDGSVGLFGFVTESGLGGG